ncbi:SOCS box domain-containing protein [Caerostris extrusa]|uniref:SOCS box domain-containing protein n=1 Tax=Caerostris extrusa TaxID=172846 RepID=A0AAV4UZ14_CAEEX|nr:SOCS box domain-containing protein [Caerostris extrusa]
MRNLSQVEGHWPYIKSFCIYPSNVVLLFYKNLFIDMITSAIGQTDQIVNVIRKLFKPLQFILKPFKRNNGSQYYQYHFIDLLLPTLYKESLDSNVIKDFLCTFDFEWFITMNQNPEMEEYIFHRAHEDNIYLWRKISDINLWVAQCIISPHIERLNLFLKYHNTLEFEVKHYEKIMATLVTDMSFPLNKLSIHSTGEKSTLSRRRYLLSLLVFHCYILARDPTNINAEEAQNILKLIWNSIPDPYLSSEELDETYESLKIFFNEHLFTKNIPEILEFYHETVSESGEYQEPRSLQHLCRIQVRERLSHNFQLPKGLEELKNMPSKVKSYLQLEL